MGPQWLTLVLLGVLACAALGRSAVRLPARDASSSAASPAAPVRRPRRPLEQIARDARRLGPQVQDPPRGISFAKYQAACHAYDRVLAEGCAALGVEHLLDVLEPGPERDAERTRVEGVLWVAGLRIDPAA